MKTRIARTLRHARYACPTAVLAMGVVCPVALGAPGDLDPEFATGGRFIPGASGTAWTIEKQGDNFLLAGGNTWWNHSGDPVEVGFAIRVSNTGTFDPEFVARAVDHIQVLDIAMQDDGRIVGIGRSNELLAFRIGPDGAIDSSFGTDGIGIRSLWPDWPMTGSIVLDPGGAIVVAASQASSEIKVTRRHANSDPDTTFGTAGVVTLPARTEWWTAPRILSAAGGGYRITYDEIDSTSTISGCRVIAVTSSGEVDAAFGDAGSADLGTPTGQAIRCNAMVQLPDGRILLGGARGAHPFVIRLLANGAPDASFAIDPLAATAMAEVKALAIDADTGDVLVAGQPANGVPGATAARLRADGSLDELFGSGGTAWIDMPGSSSVAVNDIAVLPTGDVLVAGGHEGGAFAARLVGGDGRDGAGVLGVGRFVYQATEASEALVTVRRIGGKSGSVSVAYRTEPQSSTSRSVAAIEGADFSAVSGRLDWGDGDASDKQLVVPVAPSAGAPEEAEFFNVILSEAGGGAGLGTSVAAVEIAADGSPAGQFAIYDSGEIDEAYGTLQVGVHRNYYTTGAVSVTVTPRSGTATTGDDFTANAVTLSWKDGEGGQKVIEIPINDDSSEEPGEQFTLELSDATGGAVIGPHSTTTISISDNDAPAPGESRAGGGGGRVGFFSLLLLGIARALRLRRNGATLRTTT